MEKILVVDNDKLFLEMMNDFLSKEGHEVVTAEDGLSAIDVLKTYTPDIIFVDLIMPKIDGKKLCKIIRKVKRLKDVYLIVLSSFVSELEANIADLKVDGYIPKGPLDQMMRDVIDALVEVDTLSLRRSLGEAVKTEGKFEGRVKEELLASKRHFESIVERSAEGILEITVEGRVVYANEAALSLIDMPEDKLLGSHFIELFPKDDRQRIGEFLTPIGKRPKVITKDSPAVLKGHPVSVNVMPMEGDEPTAVIVLNEVGKRKRAETAVHVARGIPDKGIEEQKGRLSKENEELREEIREGKRETERLQRAHDELQRRIEKQTSELLKENERLRKEVEAGRRETERLQSAHGALQRQMERRIVEPSKENERLREQASDSKRKMEKLQRYHEKLQRQMKKQTSEFLKTKKLLEGEMENRKRIEKAVRESEEKDRTISESIEEGYYEVDTSGNFTFCNNTMTRILGYSDSELLLMNARQVMNKENAERVFEIFDSVMKTGEPAKALDWALLRIDGSKCDVQASVIPMMDSKGQPLGFCGIIIDVSERRLAKEERLHREKLEAALEKVHDVCRKLDRAMETTLESCQVLLSEMPDDDPSFERLKMIMEQAAKMNITTGELIKLSGVQTRVLFQILSSSQSRSD